MIKENSDNLIPLFDNLSKRKGLWCPFSWSKHLQLQKRHKSTVQPPRSLQSLDQVSQRVPTSPVLVFWTEKSRSQTMEHPCDWGTKTVTVTGSPFVDY